MQQNVVLNILSPTNIRRWLSLLNSICDIIFFKRITESKTEERSAWLDTMQKAFTCGAGLVFLVMYTRSVIPKFSVGIWVGMGKKHVLNYKHSK